MIERIQTEKHFAVKWVF